MAASPRNADRESLTRYLAASVRKGQFGELWIRGLALVGRAEVCVARFNYSIPCASLWGYMLLQWKEVSATCIRVHCDIEHPALGISYHDLVSLELQPAEVSTVSFPVPVFDELLVLRPTLCDHRNRAD